MGCGGSSEPKADKKAAGKAKEKGGASKGPHAADRTSKADSSHRSSSLEIPLPEDAREPNKDDSHVSKVAESVDVAAAAAAEAITPSVREPDESVSRRAASEAARDERRSTFSPSRAWIEQLANASFATTSSAPRLFRLEEDQPAASGTMDWQWWFEAVRMDGVTKDGTARRLLQDLPNRLGCQHDEDPDQVELNLSTCYLERAAPYLLGRLFATTHLVELQWVTSLRLDGNYVADEGFGVMLATMSEANEHRSVLPHLEQLYLNNMNLDARTVSGLLFYLFPYDTKQLAGTAPPSSRKRARRASARVSDADQSALSTLDGRVARHPSADFAPFQAPTKPLFPRLSLLSVSENQSLGVDGLLEMLRNFLLTHHQPHTLTMVDISWCNVDEYGVAVAAEFAQKVLQAREQGRNPVVPSSLVLMGNPLGRSANELQQDVPSATDEPQIRFVV